ncbi:MAG: hypothetical protein V4580_03525 [Bacteroidota bacterium]
MHKIKLFAIVLGTVYFNAYAQEPDPRHTIQASIWRPNTVIDSLKVNDTLTLTSQTVAAPNDIIFNKHRAMKQLMTFPRKNKVTKTKWVSTGGWFGWYLPLSMDIILNFPDRRVFLKLKPVSTISSPLKLIVTERNDVPKMSQNPE